MSRRLFPCFYSPEEEVCGTSKRYAFVCVLLFLGYQDYYQYDSSYRHFHNLNNQYFLCCNTADYNNYCSLYLSLHYHDFLNIVLYCALPDADVGCHLTLFTSIVRHSHDIIHFDVQFLLPIFYISRYLPSPCSLFFFPSIIPVVISSFNLSALLTCPNNLPFFYTITSSTTLSPRRGA